MPSCSVKEGEDSPADGQAGQGVQGDGQLCPSQASTAAEMHSASGTRRPEGSLTSRGAAPPVAEGGTNGTAAGPTGVSHQRARLMALK
eukprot:7187636-Pyramimonas_sp.AAC.1